MMNCNFAGLTLCILFIALALPTASRAAEDSEIEEVVVIGRLIDRSALPPDFMTTHMSTAHVRSDLNGRLSPAEEKACHSNVERQIEVCRVFHSTSEDLSCTIATVTSGALVGAGAMMSVRYIRPVVSALSVISAPAALTQIAGAMTIGAIGATASAMCAQYATFSAMEYCEGEFRDTLVKACASRGYPF